ncbi:MAG TPA: biotin/lipoyl-containing protein [Candidatus Acidoferrales bacterium]
MKLDVHIGGRKRMVQIERGASPPGAAWKFWLDGRPAPLDAAEIATGVYSILLEGRAFEVRVQPELDGLHIFVGGRELAAVVHDPRSWHGKRGGAAEATGRQQISAPMPGKVVRVLVNEGDEVQAGQGLVVVEAMKMQNEIRSPMSGRVERLMVREGQPVNAGDPLAVVA